jgi:carboxyl-terminal processing protease
MKWKIMVLMFIGFSSCEKLFFDDNPSNTPKGNFEIFWGDFCKYYAQFEIRGINWDSIHEVYEPLISSGTTNKELFDQLSKIIAFINDGHVDLFSPLGHAGASNKLFNTASCQLLNQQKYIEYGPVQKYRDIIEYRGVKGKNIGYILLKKFTGKGKGLDYMDERYLVIDDILREFKDKQGIIIDLRTNGGGNSVNAETIASRFADEKRLSYKYYQKIGSGKHDFSDWYDCYIGPNGPAQYLKPVVVLTSRRTFSSAEIFILYMKAFPHVHIVGDTTRGGIGGPIYRELPNGWTFRLSTKVAAGVDGHIIEGKGIAPDYAVINTANDSINGNDRMLEMGIGIIENANK